MKWRCVGGSLSSPSLLSFSLVLIDVVVGVIYVVVSLLDTDGNTVTTEPHLLLLTN